MFRKSFALFIIAMMIFSLSVVVTAQDEESLLPTTLEDLTATADEFYGQTVILEGVLVEYINLSSFILGEGAALDDDRVLVINNSGEYFPLNLFRGESVIVTGIVHPSLEARNTDEEGQAEVVATPQTEATPMTDEMDQPLFEDVFEYYYTGSFPEEFNGYTVIELTSIEDLTRMEMEE